jgi:hypothetical protein
VNITALSSQLVAWFKNQGAELLQTGKTQATAQAFKAGEQYLGQVQQTLQNGRSLVLVGETRLDMALPKDIRPGDSVRLVYVTSGPRPTFQLATTATTPVQAVRLSDTAQQVNALTRFAQSPPTAATPNTAPASAPDIAANARAANIATTPSDVQPAATNPRPIVANVAQFTAPAASPPLTSAMTGGAANPGMALVGQSVDSTRAALSSHASLMSQGIVNEDNAHAAVLPMRLRQVLSESGMFYESHLGRWTQGRMTLDAIQREPQARLSEYPGRVLDMPGLEGMPEEAARLAGRQLQMLEGASFYWQGFAWPDQRMEWLVGEDAGENRDDTETHAWRTHLRLELPRLGDIMAEMSIGAAGLRIALRTSRDTTLDEIRAALPELVDRLRAAELNPTGIEAGLDHGESGIPA